MKRRRKEAQVRVGSWVAIIADPDGPGIGIVRLGKIVKIVEPIQVGYEKVRQSVLKHRFLTRGYRLDVEFPDGKIVTVGRGLVVQLYRWVHGQSKATVLHEGDQVELASRHYFEAVTVRGIFYQLPDRSWQRTPASTMQVVLRNMGTNRVKIHVVGTDVSDYVPGTMVKAILL